MNRPYAQYCGLARSLDHVGDRWTLLIIRELLVGPARFSELQDGLPGVASNLLVERLRKLEVDGIVCRSLTNDGSAAVVYQLTNLGGGLEEAVLALIRWGTNWMLSGSGDDAFRPRWLVIALRATLVRSPVKRPVALAIECGGQTVGVTRDQEGLHVTLDHPIAAKATVRGSPEAILALATRTRPLDDLIRAKAVDVVGSERALRRALFANANEPSTA